MLKRAVFDDEVELTTKPLCVGDAVLAKGQPGTLIAINGKGCTVEFRAGEIYEQITYHEMDGRKGGERNARLQRPPPTLVPDPRKARSDGVTLATIALVRAHCEERCARSPQPHTSAMAFRAALPGTSRRRHSRSS